MASAAKTEPALRDYQEKVRSLYILHPTTEIHIRARESYMWYGLLTYIQYFVSSQDLREWDANLLRLAEKLEIHVAFNSATVVGRMNDASNWLNTELYIS